MSYYDVYSRQTALERLAYRNQMVMGMQAIDSTSIFGQYIDPYTLMNTPQPYKQNKKKLLLLTT